MQNVKVGGWLPEQPKSNDLLFSDAKFGFVKRASNTQSEYCLPEHTPVSDQLTLSTCVANASCDAAEILLGIEGKQVQQLSRLFLYWNARLYTNDTDKDEGTFVRNAFDAIKTFGVCLESTWKYDVNKVFAQPPIKAYKEAFVNKIEAFYKIASTGYDRVDDIELAIRSNHPVVFGTAVTKEFTQYFGGNKVWQNANGDIAGNHAMIVVGVREVNGRKQFKIRNSWSQSWGDLDDAGHTWFDEQYMAASYTSDLWVPTRVPSLVI